MASTWIIRRSTSSSGGTALAEGLRWDWESFPDYLDAIERRRYAIDLGAHMPHAALRAYEFLELPTVAVRGKSLRMRVFTPLVDGEPYRVEE